MKTDNELIAEFMGGQSHHLDDGFGKVTHVIWFLPGNHPNPHCGAGTYKRPEDLEYHLRWDWLMPVVDRIQHLEDKFDIQFGYGLMANLGIQSNFVYCRIESWNGKEVASMSGKPTLIECVYQTIVDFIKWHNSLTPTP